MFLSIIIPIFNDEKYINECLDSCLHQDLMSSDYEIICVDDGSTDRTRIILQEYKDLYPNIVLIFQEHGAASGRDVGLENARGEYVWFVDHDDLIEENCLGLLKGITDKSKCERLLFPYYEFNGRFTEQELLQRKNGTLDLSCTKRYPSEITIWASVFNRQFLNDNNLWPRSRQVPRIGPIYGADEFFAHECNDYISNIAVYSDRPLYFYRKFWGSGSRTAGMKSLRRKQESYFNRSVTSMEKACQWREKYEAERKEFGEATEETTVKMIRWLRESRVILSGLSSSYWKRGNDLLKERGFEPFSKPSEYRYDCKTHLKNTKSSKQPILFRAAYYYSYKKSGATLYRLLDFKTHISRTIQKSERLTLLKRRLQRKAQ